MKEALRLGPEELLARVAQGDRIAFEALYDSTSARLHALCLSLLRDRPEAEDVLERVFVRVWREAADHATSHLSVMGWLITMTRDMALQRLRSRAASGDLRPCHVPRSRFETPAAHVPERQHASAGLAAVDPERAEALRLIYFEGLGYADLASALSVPAAELRDWLRPALLELGAATPR